MYEADEEQLLECDNVQPPLSSRGRAVLKWLALGIVAVCAAAAFANSAAPAGLFRPTAPRFIALFDGQGVCSAEGTWDDGEGPVDFAIIDSTVSLAVAGLPRLLMTVGAKGVERLNVGDASVEMEEGAEYPEEVKAGLAKISRSFAASRSKGLSDYLASQGWNGKDRPCAYNMHMLLLLLAKENQRAEEDQPAEERELEGWPHYGGEDVCPPKAAATWRCRTEPTFGWNGPWLAPGSKDLGGYGSSPFTNVNCETTKVSDAECHGLCGAKCDCWESVCGSDYLCEYNPICCAHDYACDKGMLTSKCMDSFVSSACSNEGLKTYGPSGTVNN